MSMMKGVVEVLEPVSHTEVVRSKGRSRGRGARYDLPEALVERFAAWVEDDEYLDLKEEIAITRSMLSQQLLQWKQWERVALDAHRLGSDEIPNPPVTPKQIAEAIEFIGKMVERQHRMETSSSNLVTVEAAVMFAVAVGQLVNKFVKEEKERVAVLDGIRQLLLQGQGFSVDMVVARRLLSPVRVSDVEDE